MKLIVRCINGKDIDLAHHYESAEDGYRAVEKLLKQSSGWVGGGLGLDGNYYLIPKENIARIEFIDE